MAVVSKKHIKQSALGSKIVCSMLKLHHLKSTIDVSLPLLESMGINASRLSRKDICGDVVGLMEHLIFSAASSGDHRARDFFWQFFAVPIQTRVQPYSLLNCRLKSSGIEI